MTSTTTTSFNERKALLVMDLQPATLSLFGGDSQPLLSHTAAAIRCARQNRVGVVYVRVAFRPGHPEISPANRIFSGLRGSPFLLEGAADADIHPGVSPEPDDVIITKHRVGAFWGTDLDQVLRAKGIDTLILAGYATSGVVLTTVGDAADKDYYISVLSDCVTDNNQEVHQTLLTSVFPSQALVQTSDEFAESL